jgi:hypothetical protein
MKAQASVEFMILISIMLLISAVFLMGGASLQEEMIFIKLNRQAQDIVDGAAFEINSAIRAGDGYSRRFYVEENFAYNYTLTLEGNYMVINWNGKTNVAESLVDSINGNIDKGWNIIRNTEGVIYIE